MIEKDGKDGFELLFKFKFTVPKEYNEETHLASFSKKRRGNFWSYSGAINNRNFKATELVSGKTYTVKIFEINRRVTSKDCLDFLKTQKAMLVGPWGLSLLWECQDQKEKFPITGWMISFDEKNARMKGAVSAIGRYEAMNWVFVHGNLKDDHIGRYLLCFCE